jgi:hypothetical protein
MVTHAEEKVWPSSISDQSSIASEAEQASNKSSKHLKVSVFKAQEFNTYFKVTSQLHNLRNYLQITPKI